MDWSTVLASAGVSAVVGAVASLLAVSQTTVRQQRAARRELARHILRQAVAPLLDELARYEYLRRDNAKARRSGEAADMEDHARVVAIRAAATDLLGWRRALVDRRCGLVFGEYWTNLARDYPTKAAAGPGSLGAWFAAAVSDHDRKPGAGPRDGLMHRAYSRPPGDPLQAELRRELRRLAAAR